MKLYYSPGACSLSVHIALREMSAQFDLDKVDVPNKKTSDGGDYWLVNPKGYVPTLRLDDGSVLTEVGVVLQYLADQKPEAGLAPAYGTTERYHLMEWLNFTATEVHKQLGALFNPKMTPEMREVQLGTIERRFNALERMLGGRSYVMGERFSVGDAYLFTVLNWTGLHKIDVAKWPNIKAYLERVRSRPKVQEALKAEGLLR
jgi:glutathione S-transferase